MKFWGEAVGRRVCWSRILVLMVLTVLTWSGAQVVGPEPAAGAEKIRLALLDDPSRDVYLYALQEGIVASPEVEVEVTLLPMPAIIEAVGTRQFDLVETAGVALPLAARRGFPLLAASPALVNEDGTYLFVAADSPIQTPADLRGKVIGVSSLGGTFMLELRYLLQQHGIDADMTTGEVRFQEVPAETVPLLLERGQIHAALLLHAPAYRFLQEDRLRVLSAVTREIVTVTGQPIVNSVLATYPETVARRGGSVRTALELLRRSADYARSHWREVAGEVARRRGISPDFLDWWAEGQNMELGVPMAERKEALAHLWSMAGAVGDLPAVPDVEDFLF